MTERQREVLESYKRGNTTISEIVEDLNTTVAGVKKTITQGEHLYYTDNGYVYPSMLESVGKSVELSTNEKIENMRKELKMLEEQSRLEHQPKKLVNLTRHPVVIENSRMSAKYMPSGIVCRVNTKSVVVDSIDDVLIREDNYCEIVNYPNVEGEVYIVSGKVGSVLNKLGYTNYVMCDTKRSVIKNGKILSVENFWRYPVEDVHTEEK